MVDIVEAGFYGCHPDCCVAMGCGEKISSVRLSPFSWHLQISLGFPLDPATEDLFASMFLASRSLEAQKPSPAEPPSLAGCRLDFSPSVPSRLTPRVCASGYPGSWPRQSPGNW